MRSIMIDSVFQIMQSHFFLQLLLVSLLPTQGNAAIEITLKAGFVPSDTFGSFQMDLLQRLTQFAIEMDNVDLSFELTDVQALYTSNLPLIGPDCHAGASVVINDISYNCSDFDIIVGDFWPNPNRFILVDFTPPWLQTSLSSLKYTDKIKFPGMDVTTLTEAMRKGASVCVSADSTMPKVLERLFPGIHLVNCTDGDESESACLNQLKREQCFLLVSDELALRRIQADKPYFEMTGEQLEHQWLAWPVRRSLDPATAFLLNKWIYAALNNQTITELYFEYFAKKLCPIGTAGKKCQVFCDPNHGSADAAGECVCDSPRWTGDDCSIEIAEDVNSIPSALIATAYTMLASIIFIILVCGVWLYWQRKSLEVRVSQPQLLSLVLFGCLLSSFTIVAMVAAQDYTFGDPAIACMAIPWLYSVGFSITFGTLFGKIRRVYKLFTLPASSSSSVMSGSSRRNVDSVQVVLCIGGVLLVDVAILIVWSVIDPLVWERKVIRQDQFGDSLESVGYCTCDSTWIFPSIIPIFHFGLMAVACYMCYVARNIPSMFSEHKFVTIATISNLQIFMVGVPTLLIVHEDPAGRFFVRSMVVWMNNLVVVTLIFGNLMYSVHFPSKQDDNASSDEKFVGLEETSWGVTEIQYCPKPPSPRDPGIVVALSDTDQDEIILPAKICDKKKQYRQGMSSLSLQSDVFSQEGSSSVKCVSFNENVSISEIPSMAYQEIFDQHHSIRIGNDRFAAPNVVEKAPLKPARSSTSKGMIYGCSSSLELIPSVPQRPVAFEVEDVEKKSAGASTTAALLHPLGESRRRVFMVDQHSAPCLPVRVISTVSELEEVVAAAADTDNGTSS